MAALISETCLGMLINVGGEGGLPRVATFLNHMRYTPNIYVQYNTKQYVYISFLL